MPLFSILFFLLCLANCGAPLTLNFIGEFLSLYGVFERSSLFGVFASSSIIFSAAYTIYMYQRIAFGGVYSRMFTISIPDLNKREFTVLWILLVPTVLFGIYPAVILDCLHYSVSTLIYALDFNVISCDSPDTWEAEDMIYYMLYQPSSEPVNLLENIPIDDLGLVSPYPDPSVWGECLDCDDTWKWSGEDCDCRDLQGDR